MDKSKIFQNKWLIAFIAVAVALVAAIVVIIVMGVSSTPDVPDGTTPGDGAETGVYYYDVEGGEVILSLNSGNKFTLAGIGINKSGTYTVDGESLALDFFRDEDGTATATVTDKAVTITYSDNSVMTFLKKVNYTVTFNTNGGSETASVTVVNGKPVAKPADPTKDGSVFLGWYADEALTSTYDFNATVTGDVTVYAYWAEKSVGQLEYTAKFDLGYDGATEIESIETIGGKLYQLPTPQRDGYTFMGWYVSDYEDSNKLTYQYADGMVLSANSTLFAVWKDNADTKLTAPQVSVSGNTIKWNSVEGASSYTIKILDSEGNLLHSETLGATQKTYDFSDRAAGDYTVEVTAIASDSANNSAPAVRSYKNKALNRVSLFQVVNGVLVFNPVENADRYYITVDCGNSKHEHTMLNNNTSTVYDFSGCSMQPGGIKFTVTATAAGYASSVSETFVYDRTLASVGTIVYNNTTDSFVWDAVANATGYKVEVICGDNTTVFTVPTTYFNLANFSGNITVKVSPVSDGYNSPAAVTGAFNKTAPAAPTNIKINGMIVSWDDNGSSSYSVKIGTKQFTVSTNSIDLTNRVLALADGEECEIKVVAINNGEYSAESSITAKYRDMSETLTYQGNTVYWPAVIGSSKFEVRVNGGKSVMVTGENSAKIVLTKAGTNLIEVRCADTPGAIWYSVEVFAYTVTYNSRSLNGIVTEYVAPGDALSMTQSFTNAGYTFGGWYTTPAAASGNGKEYTSGILNSVGDMILYANWTPNEYKFNFNVSDNVEVEAPEWPVTYMKDFILPIPSSTGEQEGHYFLGWFTGPAGTGEQITDALGQSLDQYKVIGDSTLYPFFSAALTFVREEDGTYGVRQGPGLANKAVVNIIIPAEYNGIPVTKIKDNAFYYCENIETIRIPNTIEKIGVGAFEVCRSLNSVEVYDVNTDPLYEAAYDSHDGALIYHDEKSQKTYLEFFPRAKVGTYTIPEGVTNIKAYAFKYSTIEKVIIGKDVTTVADSSFYKCSKLTSIEFEFDRSENVTISKAAFEGLTKLTTLVFPAKLNEIEEMKTLLDSLPSLTTINVEKGGEFYSSLDGLLCDGLGTELLYVPVTYNGDNGVFKAPLGLKSIGAGVFEANTALTEVIIPVHLSTIGTGAFKDCTSITKVTVMGPRSGALTIGEESFTGCTAITTLDFVGAANANVKGAITVGTAAFKGCVELDTLNIGENVNVSMLGDNAFEGNIALEDILVADTATLSKIGNSTFKGCSRLKTFTIHKTTRSIGNSAFADCTYLNTVSFAEGGGEISFGSYVFQKCEALKKIKLPSTLTSFDGSAFDGCDKITEIEVSPDNEALAVVGGILYTKDMTELLYYPRNLEIDFENLPWDTLTKLGASAFKNNSKLTNITIGANIVELGAGAFENCINLENVTFANTESDMILGDRVFMNCAKLTNITLPTKTAKIGNSAFYMTGLEALDIPDTVTEIGAYAFSYTDIASIDLPATLTKLGVGAFNNAGKLTTVTFAEGTEDLYIGNFDEYVSKNPMEEIDETKVWAPAHYGPIYGIFYGTKIAEISLPSNLKVVDDYAFYGVSTLTSVTIPESVRLTNIGDHAFAKTSFPSITLGSNLEVIEQYAFAYSKLQSAIIPATTTHIYSYAFAASTFTSITFEAATDPDATLEIAYRGFAGANLNGVLTLPAHLAQIGTYDNSILADDVLAVFYDYKSSSSIPYTEIEYAERSKLANNMNLTAIEVAEGNTRYAAIDGVLYARSLADPSIIETLQFCPRSNPGDENGVITVPKSVTYVQSGAFYQAKDVKKIIFEEYDKNDENYGKQLLQIGSYVGTAYNTYPVFGTESANKVVLEEISLPSHLSIVYSRGFTGLSYKVNNNAPLVVRFNPDALVEFEQASMRNNSGITELHLPMLSRVALQAFYGQSGATVITIAPGSTATEFGNRAFESCSKITTLDIPASVEALGEACFRYCSKLTGLTYDKDGEGVSNITSIGTECFKSCSQLTEFSIPEGVTVMGTKAFESCSNLKTISIPASLENVVPSSGSLISGCTTITAINVAEGHPYLMSEDGVLYDKDKTTLYIYPAAKGAGFVIPDTIVNIEGGALYKYPGTSITLPEGLLHINNNAFASSSLTSITIPASVQTIKSYAFNEAKSLRSIVFDNIRASKLELIGACAFYGTPITELVLPDSVKLIGAQAFHGCSSLTSAVLPAALNELGDQVFRYCSSLETVTMQEGLAHIGNSVFNYAGVKNIVFPDSVATIGNSVFQNCTELESVIFSENSKLASMGTAAFYSCSSLKKVTFGPLLEEFLALSWSPSPFTQCPKLEEIVLPANLAIIADSLFAGCTNLKTVVMPTALTQIGANAFNGCANIEYVYIAKTVTSIGENAFAGCSSLTSVNFDPACAIKVIADGAFEETVNLTDITIPETVTEFGARAFKNSALATTPIGPNVTKIGDEAFYGCKNITTLSIPSGVKNIGNRAFYGCSSLETLALSSGLKNIGDFAFAYTNITSAIIPDTVTGITANPFMGCTSLETIDVLSPDFYYDTENGVLFDKNITMLLFYAPFNTAETYEIPAMVDITGGAFANSQLMSIVLPESTKKIPAGAFKDSKKLESVVIPASITEIEDDAFNGCAKLNNVTVPASVTSIGNYAFAGCSSLSSFTLADRKTNIEVGEHLFDGCASLATIIDFPGLTAFTPYMYAGTAIVDLVIPENITNLYTEGVFANCVNLKTVDFGTAVNGALGDRMFKGCISLESITTPESVYSLGGNIGETFMGCTSLKTVTTFATTISPSNFENCTALTTVTFNGDPRSMVRVERYAFRNCTGLSSMEMFNKIYGIGEEAFKNCTSLVGEITFGQELDSIDNNAFYGATGITQISFGRANLRDYSFSGLTSSTTVYLRNYKTYEEYANDWNNVVWMENSDVTIKYYTPATPGAVTLDTWEIELIEAVCDKAKIRDVELAKSKALEFKTNYVTLYPTKELSGDETKAIHVFCETVGTKETDAVINSFIDYRIRLSKTMLESAFDSHEQDLIQTCLDKYGLSYDNLPAFHQSLYEYKRAYADRNPANELDKEEQSKLQDWMKEMGFKDEDGTLLTTFTKNFIAYKKYLASKMPVQITHVITDNERTAVEALVKQGVISEKMLDAVLEALLEYKTNFTTLNLDPKEVSNEEIEMLRNFCKEHDIKTEVADGWIKGGSYVAFKQKLAARTSLSDTERQYLEGWLKKELITDETFAKLEERILAYKASFNMTAAPETADREAVAALQTFLKEQGADASVIKECIQGYLGYIQTLVKEIM